MAKRLLPKHLARFSMRNVDIGHEGVQAVINDGKVPAVFVLANPAVATS